ncbi:DNA-binding MarR family transcriptional regulator [Clavibacter michiganensis]|nr:DNA-binding MarR family transcriptional regulator [Clavibacter michiganensis]
MLKRLELLGFISRSRDAANERRLSVALTNAGIALIPELQQIHARVKQVIGLNSVDQQLLQEFVASIPVAPTAV